MDKTEVIETLNKAVISHKAWISNAQALIEGVPLDKESVPVNATECAFGKWYYGEGQKLKTVPGFKELEKQHDRLHGTYMEIFSILFGEGKKEPSFFSKLIGRSHKVAAENREQAMGRFLILKDQSTRVIDQLEQLQKVINAMGDKQLANHLS
jgi:hypothetical protein